MLAGDGFSAKEKQIDNRKNGKMQSGIENGIGQCGSDLREKSGDKIEIPVKEAFAHPGNEQGKEESAGGSEEQETATADIPPSQQEESAAKRSKLRKERENRTKIIQNKSNGVRHNRKTEHGENGREQIRGQKYENKMTEFA